MFIIKIIGKILLIPVWIIVIFLNMIVSVAVNLLGVTRAISGIILTLLLIGTVICYQDHTQILFLLALIIVGYILLFAGVTIEVILERIKIKVRNIIMA